MPFCQNRASYNKNNNGILITTLEMFYANTDIKASLQYS